LLLCVLAFLYGATVALAAARKAWRMAAFHTLSAVAVLTLLAASQ
jgi:hypothetical protein